MPDYVNITSLRLIKSVDPTEVEAGTVEITHAELEAAALIPQHYRKWNGTAVEEMTQAEKDAVDAAEVQARKDQGKAEIDGDTKTKALAAATYKLVKRVADGNPMPTAQQFIDAIKQEVQDGIG
jgi:hypothetical protein